MRFVQALIFVFVIGFTVLAACTSMPSSGGQPALPKSTLIIETAQGPVEFIVEFADEPNEIQMGMMFRQSIGKNEGMLFDIGHTRVAFFWMRNTLISLDIIFVDGQGRIINVAANATPLSEETLYSEQPARGVLEIRGGRSAELGIASGSIVRHSLFENDLPLH